MYFAYFATFVSLAFIPKHYTISSIVEGKHKAKHKKNVKLHRHKHKF